MSEGTPTTDDQASPANGSDANGPQAAGPTLPPREPQLALPENDRHQPTIDELLSRIRRLEEQYAAIQDTKQLEDRVAQRVTTRLRRKTVTNMRLPEPLPASSDLAPAGDISASSEPFPPEDPPATPLVSAGFPSLALPDKDAPSARPLPVDMAGTGIAPLATVLPPSIMPPEAPVAAVAAPFLEPPAATAPASRVSWLWRSWLVLDILNELRVMFRMIVDPRYRLTWPARIVPIVVIVLMLLSDIEKLAFLFPWNLAPGLGYYLNKLFQIALTFIMFKVLEREVDRYRDKVPDAPPPLRP